MIAWFRKMSERAQRQNVERTIELLVRAAKEVDLELLHGRTPSEDGRRCLISMQRALLVDVVGPVPIDVLRKDYLEPILASDRFGEGEKLAVRHVFESAEKSGRRTGLEIVSWEEFKRRVLMGWSPRMGMSIYQALSFDCACGERHLFGQAAPLKELPGMRLVLSCPRLAANGTCVKVKGLFRIRLESEFGSVGD
ncbi:hypothetical protein [Corallococcus exercitus]|uniref:hypothetical protein n=1 Tax=Corallococcus exercitus TaxID=2316736 RepID=UPI0035D4411A